MLFRTVFDRIEYRIQKEQPMSTISAEVTLAVVSITMRRSNARKNAVIQGGKSTIEAAESKKQRTVKGRATFIVLEGKRGGKNKRFHRQRVYRYFCGHQYNSYTPQNYLR